MNSAVCAIQGKDADEAGEDGEGEGGGAESGKSCNRGWPIYHLCNMQHKCNNQCVHHGDIGL